jgi:hypothetical protein
MTAVSRSSRIAQSPTGVPLSMKRRRSICCVSPSKVRKMIQDRSADRNSRPWR